MHYNRTKITIQGNPTFFFQTWYEKKDQTVMLNNSTKINKTNKITFHLESLNTHTHTYKRQRQMTWN